MSPIPANKPPDTTRRHEVFRDLVTGCLSVGAASLLAISHFGQSGRLHADYGSEPGPALLPELLLAVLGIAGVVLILRGVLSRRVLPAKTGHVELAAGGDSESADSQSQPFWAFFVLGITIAFGLLQAVFGFGIAAAALGAVLCATLAVREGRPLLRSAAEGVAVAAVLYGIFRYVLSVPLT